MQTKFQQLIGWPTRPRQNPLIPRMGIFASIAIWWGMSSELTQMAKRIAGDAYYNSHREAIKYEIRRRVSAVIKGFDRRSQTLLFKCNLMDDVVPRTAGKAAKGGAR